MRRLSFIWMILILVLVLVGCKSKETDGEPEKTSFNAVVLEINGDILLVEPEEDAAERKSCDRIQVGLSGMEESRTSELLDTVKAGDIVCVTYNGEIDSTVADGEIPMKEHQSNFGTGYGFQYAPDDVIEVYIDEQWRVFEKYQ